MFASIQVNNMQIAGETLMGTIGYKQVRPRSHRRGWKETWSMGAAVVFVFQ